MTYPTITPKLTLDFANSRQLDPRITFSRSDPATYLHPDTGLITTAPSGVARFEKEGFLIEEGRTNNFLNSNDCTQWNPFRVNVGTDTGVVAPDGSTSVGWVESILGNSGGNVKGGTLSNTTGPHSMFVWAKHRAGAPWIAIGPGQPGSQKYAVFFNLATGEIGSAGSGLTGQYEMIPYPNGWYKIVFTGVNAQGVNNALQIWPSDSDGAVGTHTTTGSHYVWGAQVEDLKNFPTSYIPTSGSTVTRVADTVSLTGTNFSSWYNGSQGSVFIDMKRPAASSNSGAFLEFFDNAGYFLHDIGNTFVMRIGKEGTISLGPTTTTDYKIASSYQSETNYNTSSNGSTPVSASTLVDFTTATELHIGRGNNAFTSHYRIGPRTLHLKRFVYYDRRVSDAELKKLTS